MALAAAVVLGCDGAPNLAPVFEAVDEARFRVDVAGTVAVTATDPDGDPLEYRFTLDPIPPSQAEGLPGGPRFEPAGDGGVMSWTPSLDDAGPDGEATYRATFVAIDGRGGRAEMTVPVTVESRRAGPEPLRFAQPTAEGVLLTGDCVRDVPVAVVGEGHDPQTITIQGDATAARCDGQPDCAPLALDPPGPGVEKTFGWCPTPTQLMSTVQHGITFEARSLVGDAVAEKRFFARFHRPSGAGCGGEPPVIEHDPPEAVDGALDHVITARITDDLEIKTAPVLAYAIDAVNPPADPRMVDGWQAVAFTKQAADRWQAAIPNLGLAPGEAATVHYAIYAVDNDDQDSTACDHATEAGVFSFEVRGREGEQPAYPPCTPCRADRQCGGDADRCAILFDGAFCARACADQEDCGDDEVCASVPSVDGIDAFLCVPADQNCGQLCADDPFEMPPNDGPDRASAVEPGRVEGLTLCDEDEDWFAVPIAAGEAIDVRATFDGGRGDLDLGLLLPGSADFEHQSVGGGGDVEQVREPCAPEAGEALVAVWAFDGRVGPYALDVMVGPGECDAPCTADRYESEAANDTLADAADVRLPFESGRLTICPGDRDFYRFDTGAGSLLRVDLRLESDRGDLGLRLWRGGELIRESAGFRQAEAIEVMAGPGAMYAVEVFGQTDRSQNTYVLAVDALDAAPCDEARDCIGGQLCVEGRCVDEPCETDRDCGDDQVCVTERLGARAEAIGGRCAPRCRGDGDCRGEAGRACKALGDKSVCLLAGAQEIGERCDRHEACAGEAVCLDLPGGYCARVGCDDCPADTACAVGPAGVEACYRACDGPGDCRVAEDYGCGVPDVAAAPVCLPEGELPGRGQE